MPRRDVRKQPTHDGRRALASRLTRPDFSARRMMPSHKAIIPASGSAKVTTAVLQASKAAAVTSPSWPDAAPSRTASTTSPSQIQLSMGGSLSHANGRLRKAILSRQAAQRDISRSGKARWRVVFNDGQRRTEEQPLLAESEPTSSDRMSSGAVPGHRVRRPSPVPLQSTCAQARFSWGDQPRRTRRRRLETADSRDGRRQARP